MNCACCGEGFAPRRPNQRYCSARCKWTSSNRSRTLKPNVEYDCAICGRHVAKYVPPADWGRNAFLYCSRRCKGKGMSEANHPMWRGGRYLSDGYIYAHVPGHPHADQRGYVREHRLVMERMIGRYLRPEEVVHHENDDTRDNRPENLRLFANQAAHKAYEMAERRRDRAGRLLSLATSA